MNAVDAPGSFQTNPTRIAVADPERLKMVTRYFNEWSGLRCLPLVTVCTWIGFIYFFPRLWAGLVLVLLIAAALILRAPLRRYYERRFGWVKSKQQSSSWIMAMAAVLLYLFVRHAGTPSGPRIFFSLVPAAMSIMLVVDYFRTARFRHYLLPTAAALFVFALLPFLYPLRLTEDQYQGLIMLSITIPAIAISLLDHWALVRLMPRAPEEGND